MTASSLPPTVPVPTAAELLGCSSWALYQAIRDGDAPVPVLRVGRKIVIPSRPLLELLGLQDEIDVRQPGRVEEREVG